MELTIQPLEGPPRVSEILATIPSISTPFHGGMEETKVSWSGLGCRAPGSPGGVGSVPPTRVLGRRTMVHRPNERLGAAARTPLTVAEYPGRVAQEAYTVP